MSPEHVDVRVFAEGIRIPCSGTSRTQKAGSPVSFSVSLPPTPAALSVLPGTFFHVFVLKKDPRVQQNRYVLFAEGRAEKRRFEISKDGRRQMRVNCKSLDANWKNASLGTQVGAETGWPRPRLMHFMSGMSVAEKSGVFPNHAALTGLKAYRMLTGGGRGSLQSFYSFKSMLMDSITGEEGSGRGPVMGLAGIIANLYRCSPLMRQNYQTTKFYKRLLFAENNAITDYMRRDFNIRRLKGNVRQMPSSSTLRQVMERFLPITFHHQVTIGSPYFNKDLWAEADLKERAEEWPEPEEPAPGEGTGGPIEDREEGLLDLSPIGEINGYEGPSPTVAPTVTQLPGTIYTLEEFASESSHLPESEWEDVPVGRGDGANYRSNAQRLAESLTTICRAVGVKMGMTCVYRSDKHQAALRKAGYNPSSTSQHKICCAADLVPPDGWTPRQLVVVIEQLMAEGKIEKGGVGLYPEMGFVHYDIRGNHCRWPDAIEETNWPGKQELQGAGDSTAGFAEAAASKQAGVMPSMFIKPYLHFAPPPRCNLFFGERINSMRAQDQFDQAPTRMMVMAEPQVSQIMGAGNMMSGMLRRLHFAPKHFDTIVDTLRQAGGQEAHTGDLLLPDEDLLEDEADRNSLAAQNVDKAMQQGTNWQAQYSAGQKNLLKAPAKTKGQNKRAFDRDIMKALYENGEEWLGPEFKRLRATSTYEELFKGVIPTTAKFHFYEPQEDVKSADDDAADIYARYNYALLSRQPRTVQFSGQLNLNVAPGFPGAIYDEACGWITGEIYGVTDTIDAQGTAQTSVQMGNATFLADRQNPHWQKIHRDNQGEFAKLSEGGDVVETALFDEEFFSHQVGESIYKPFLGVDSAIELARELSGRDRYIGERPSANDAPGADDFLEGGLSEIERLELNASKKEEYQEDKLSLGDALNIISESYLNSEKDEWGARVTARPIVTEGEFFQRVLEATPKGRPENDRQTPDGTAPAPDPEDQTHDVYEGVFRADTIQQAGSEPVPSFMMERRAWAEEYILDLDSRQHAMDVSKPKRREGPREGQRPLQLERQRMQSEGLLPGGGQNGENSSGEGSSSSGASGGGQAGEGVEALYRRFGSGPQIYRPGEELDIREYLPNPTSTDS